MNPNCHPITVGPSRAFPRTIRLSAWSPHLGLHRFCRSAATLQKLQEYWRFQCVWKRSQRWNLRKLPNGTCVGLRLNIALTLGSSRLVPPQTRIYFYMDSKAWICYFHIGLLCKGFHVNCAEPDLCRIGWSRRQVQVFKCCFSVKYHGGRVVGYSSSAGSYRGQCAWDLFNIWWGYISMHLLFGIIMKALGIAATVSGQMADQQACLWTRPHVTWRGFSEFWKQVCLSTLPKLHHAAKALEHSRDQKKMPGTSLCRTYVPCHLERVLRFAWLSFNPHMDCTFPSGLCLCCLSGNHILARYVNLSDLAKRLTDTRTDWLCNLIDVISCILIYIFICWTIDYHPGSLAMHS